MYFSTAIFTVALTGLASAADIAGWTGRGCTGSSLICAAIVANRCCSPFSTSTLTIAWTLPGNSRGFGYTATSCSSGQSTAVFGSRTNACFFYDNNIMRSAKWVTGTGFSAKFAKRDEEEDCAKPNVYAYHDAEGKQIWKKIPEGKVDEVVEAFSKGEVHGAEEWETQKVIDVTQTLVENRIAT